MSLNHEGETTAYLRDRVLRLPLFLDVNSNLGLSLIRNTLYALNFLSKEEADFLLGIMIFLRFQGVGFDYL